VNVNTDANGWQKRYSEIINFMVILWQADELTTDETDISMMIDYLRKPSDFQETHELWVSCGSPDYGDAQWDHFMAELNPSGVSVDE